jgi:UDP-GlcNAc3NAcA epimerase
MPVKSFGVVSIVGARPQFIKAGPLSRALRQAGHRETMIHTGQHYDHNMSELFFEELGMAKPAINLAVGSGTHGQQTGLMLARIEEVLLAQRPDLVVVYGDTNSTISGALAGAKLGLPVTHVEAGLRSFNRSMPEEINRVVTDHLSTLLWAPSDAAVRNLAREGITAGVDQVGDIMADVLSTALSRADRSACLDRLGLTRGQYLVVTVHRAENTSSGKLTQLLKAFSLIEQPVIWPVHPRTSSALGELGLAIPGNIVAIEPMGYVDMMALTRSARLLLTDSGGLQKEAYWLGTPCLTLREETEWIETVQNGWNKLVGCDPERIIEAIHSFSPPAARPSLYGDGRAAVRCVSSLETLT